MHDLKNKIQLMKLKDYGYNLEKFFAEFDNLCDQLAANNQAVSTDDKILYIMRAFQTNTTNEKWMQFCNQQDINWSSGSLRTVDELNRLRRAALQFQKLLQSQGNWKADKKNDPAAFAATGQSGQTTTNRSNGTSNKNNKNTAEEKKKFKERQPDWKFNMSLGDGKTYP